MIRKNTIIIAVFLILYIIFNKNTVSEVIGSTNNTSSNYRLKDLESIKNMNIYSKLDNIGKKSNIDLNPKNYSDYYIDRVTTFTNLENNKGEIIFLGDSLIDICEWNELFNNSLVKNRGISGDTTYGVLNRLDEITEAQPDKVFIMMGINDIGKCRTTQSIIEDYGKVINKIKIDSPNTKIYVNSVLPINKEIFITHTKIEEILELNNALNKLCDQTGVKYINLYPLFVTAENKLNPKYTTGGIHLNGQGYLIWKEAVKDFLK
jgi:lysophospholipase L1-like esterase